MQPRRTAITAFCLAAGLACAPAVASTTETETPGAELDKQAEQTLPEELQGLPPTAAGEESLPLHFVPPNVQAFEEMGEDSEHPEGKKLPQSNLLPFSF